MKLGASPRDYLLRIKASTNNHCVGLISTNSAGTFSPGGEPKEAAPAK
jgi:hypothetical protein